MNWPRSPRNSDPVAVILAIAVALGASGCGVKGDPLPPLKPIEMGRGRPTYKRATESIKLEPDTAEDEEKH